MPPIAQLNRHARPMALPDHYKEAGVDTDEADAGLRKLTSRIQETWPSPTAFGAVKLPVGHFANVIDFGGGLGVALTTDGIGSKAMIATMMDKYDTVGIDCVAMNVNDLICVGARPVSMVDYVAIEKVEARILDEIAIGLCDGAEQAQVSISGGETSQLREMINGFDLAGTAIGHVPLDKILVGQNIAHGDVIVGVVSNGIHSNGLSLARRAFFGSHVYKTGDYIDDFGQTLGEELLRPTDIYVREAMELLARAKTLKALVHITSDGFLNLTRVERPVSFYIDGLPEVPPVFSMIERLGDVAHQEMFSVFNMGIGLCAVVSEREADLAISVLSSGGRRALRIGHVVDDGRREVDLPQHGLKGHGKHFWKVR